MIFASTRKTSNGITKDFSIRSSVISAGFFVELVLFYFTNFKDFTFVFPNIVLY